MVRLSNVLRTEQTIILSGPYGTEVAERLARDIATHPQKAAAVAVNKYIGAGCSALLTTEGRVYLSEIAADYLSAPQVHMPVVLVTPTFRLAKQTLEAAATVRGVDPHLPAMGLELCLDAVQICQTVRMSSGRSLSDTLLAMSLGPPFDCYKGEDTPRDVDQKYLPQIFAAIRFCHDLDYLMFETVPSLKAAKGAARAFTRAHQLLDVEDSKANFRNMGTIRYSDSLLSRAHYFGSETYAHLVPSYDPASKVFTQIPPTKEYVISLCLDKDGMLYEGPVDIPGKAPERLPLNDTLDAFYATVEREGLCTPVGFGINCNSLAVTEQALASLSSTNRSRMISIHPNASSEDDPRDYCNMTSQQAIPEEDYVRQVLRLKKTYGLGLIGGCCGTNGTTMRLLAQECRKS